MPLDDSDMPVISNHKSATALCLLFCLCSSAVFAQQSIGSDPAHNSANSLDWQGEYSGVVPCADCPGIELTLRLDDDLSYEVKRLYIGEHNISFAEEGRFRWLANGSRIVLMDSPAPNTYLVQENRLVMLNSDGNRIVGEQADHYILEKQ